MLLEYTKNKKIEILIPHMEDKYIKQSLSIFKMSRNVSTKKPYMPYCKVCHDAGKPEKEYTNHWLKDKNGKTVCPTLLNTECRFCHKLGHTAKFCDVIKKKEKEVIEPKPKEQKKVNISNNSNKFQSLYQDDDDEIDPNWKEPVASWASIASKPQKIEVEVVTPKDYLVLTNDDQKELLRNMYRRNWAEWPDSDDE